MDKDNKKVVKQKASFYFQEKIICHIRKTPVGFVNGKFKSDLIEDWFYWFEDARYPNEERRLFLVDIFDIKDYEVEK